MNIEKRTLLAEILAAIAFVSSCAVIGYITIKYYQLMNVMILLSVIGTLWILVGMFSMMIIKSSYVPSALILIGLTEQGAMLFIYLKIRLAFGAAAVCGLAFIMFLIYLLDPLDIREHKPEEKFEPIVEPPLPNWPDPVGQKYLKNLQKEMEKTAQIISFAEKADEIRKEREKEPACQDKDEQAS